MSTERTLTDAEHNKAEQYIKILQNTFEDEEDSGVVIAAVASFLMTTMSRCWNRETGMLYLAQLEGFWIERKP